MASLSAKGQSTPILREFESVSEGTVKLGELGHRQGGDKASEFTLEHQSEKITADCGSARQPIFWPQHDLSCESQDFPVDWGADHCRHIPMLSHKGSGHYDVKSRFSATLGNLLSRTVDLASSHGRACSEISMRACRARRLPCFRNTSLSLASIARRRSRSANSRSAVRTSADRLRSRGEPSVNSSRSFKVASSIVTAIVFILGSLSIFWSDFNASSPSLTCGRTKQSSERKATGSRRKLR